MFFHIYRLVKFFVSLPFIFINFLCLAQINISGIINTYAPVTAISFNTGTGVTNCTNVRLTIGATRGSATPFAVGDRVLIIQMQGSRPNLSNSASFGQVPATPSVDALLSSAGNFEFSTISAVSGSNITLSTPLSNVYDVFGSVQLVRVPVYTSLTNVTVGGLTASNWDGSSGGIIALICTNTLNLIGNINADAVGFAGGAPVGGGTTTCRTNFFFNSATAQGAEKGDGVAVENPNFARGKGAWANGGGGGNGDNSVASGGGGGGNGGAGGNGGQGSGCNNPGVGGYALAPSNTRIYMGGGGGGGFGTNGGTGGGGGGIVIIQTQNLVGLGNIFARGANGTNGASNGAGAGGGAGGSVYLTVNSGTNTGAKIINVSGGNGGNGNGTGGGGGGGGGGVIRTNAIGGDAITRITTAGALGNRGGSGSSANGVAGSAGVNQTTLSINTNPTCTATITDIAALCSPIATVGDEAYPAGSFGGVTGVDEVVATSGGFSNNWNGTRFKTNVAPWNTFAPGYTFRTPAGTVMTTPADGEFAIATNCVNSYSSDLWINMPDRSGNGFMMLVNCSYQPSVIFNQNISGLCEGVKYQFSVWLRNLDPGNRRSVTNPTGSADYGPIITGLPANIADVQKVFSPNYTGQGGSGSRVCPEIEFLINGAVVAITGPVPNNSNGVNGAGGANTQWTQYGVTFKPITSGTINLQLRNKAPGGGGNDIAVDDISFRPCGPVVGLVSNAPSCVPPTITANVSMDYDTPQFQWQSSVDGGITWTNVGTNSSSYIIPTPSDQSTIFRVIVANSLSSLALPSCRVVTPSIGNFCNLLLPVELLYFDAQKQENKVKVTWATAMAKENDIFVVERAIDGVNFIPIGQVKGKGDSKAKQEYSFLDTSPLKGINYYRLKQIDKNGQFTYSKIVAVNMDCLDCIEMNIYPNPSSSGIFKLTHNSYALEKVNIWVTNALGMIVYEGSMNENSYLLNLSTQSKGVYLLSLQFPQETKTYKLIIE
ncbi:T9SS type A sorting domain-containing protein [Thermoflexibacter ruber]|uniref:Por secretion system C-terminal sorting domain-containing protein n=1 Tax=Thermoflexibacter ruber TaxID=1003 RepID=A0A1I2C7M7_9BACT|nr:T9SS type A sorting domain-containing protein [Thermoflexibacter ruber]SFE64205.1 Por secretion system C-terminal sorting domain-containing protein [Thermoflexibacter ruber]